MYSIWSIMLVLVVGWGLVGRKGVRHAGLLIWFGGEKDIFLFFFFLMWFILPGLEDRKRNWNAAYSYAKKRKEKKEWWCILLSWFSKLPSSTAGTAEYWCFVVLVLFSLRLVWVLHLSFYYCHKCVLSHICHERVCYETCFARPELINWLGMYELITLATCESICNPIPSNSPFEIFIFFKTFFSRKTPFERMN